MSLLLHHSENQHIQFTHEKLDEDEDDKPLVRPDRIAVSEDEDDKLLVQPTSRKEWVEETRETVERSKVPAQVRRRKGPPVWQDPSTTLEQMCQETRVSDQKKSRFGAEILTVKLSVEL